jgi:hypothetical protein
MIGGLCYSYGGYNGHEYDFVNLKCQMFNCSDKRSKNIRLFVVTRGQKNFGQLCGEWIKWKQNGGKRCTDPFTLAPPQECSNKCTNAKFNIHVSNN